MRDHDRREETADRPEDDGSADRPDSRSDSGSRCPFHDGGAGGKRATGQAGGARDTGTGEDETANEGRTDKPRLLERAVERRAFLRSALAIGGVGALSSVSDAVTAGDDGTVQTEFDVPQGRHPSTFPERQHAWGADIAKDPFRNAVLPNHQLILLLNYDGNRHPTGRERTEVEAAFQTLERAFQRLAGGDPEGSNDGLVFMVGYSPSYFDRFEPDLPNSVDLLGPEEVLRRTGDDHPEEKADDYDAVVLLSSDTVPVLLGSEAALFGEIDTLNGVTVEGTLEGIFEKAARRTAFVGRGIPRQNLVEDPDSPLTDEEATAITDENVHDNLRDDTPLSMGYKSGFDDNVATEDAVTITTGPFKEGTTFQVSKLVLDLGEWYANDRATRDQLMFSTEHAPSDAGDQTVGKIGEELEDDSGITEKIVDDLETTAEEKGRVGHAAKTALARNDDFEPLILRRSEGVNNSLVDPQEGTVGFNFSAVMEDIQDFVETRRAMNATHLDEDIDEGGHGILPYMEVTSRATFLLPPRKHRSLPRPLPNE